jgi:uncharacterized repeat protein (TIGR01451 family)
MKRFWRPLLYGLAGAVVIFAAFAAPSAWATPGQSAHAQTVPTRTPTSGPIEPTQRPPVNTAVPPTATAAPGNTPEPSAPTATAEVSGSAGTSGACATGSSLAFVADRTAIWPGATVVFTATLTNTGKLPLRQVILEDQLAAGLEPGAVIAGNGTWQARTFTAAAPALNPGARLVAVYSATVASTLPSQAIVARMNATTAGCPKKTATVTLGLPPSQLPATGGSLD